MNNLSHIRAIIWDFDGVFYSFDGVDRKAYYELQVLANSRAAQVLFSGLTDAQARQMAIDCWEQHRDSTTLFVERALTEGRDIKQFTAELHKNFHTIGLQLFDERHPEIFAPHCDFVPAFSRLPHLKHAVLSHGCSEAWLNPLLTRMNIHGSFEYIWGLSDYDFNKKQDNAEGLRLLMEGMQVHPSEVLFIEDTEVNLEVGKRAYPELTTALISQKPRNAVSELVDVISPSSLELLQQLPTNDGQKFELNML